MKIASVFFSCISLLGLAGCMAGAVQQGGSGGPGGSVIPTLTAQPSSLTVTAGQSATFSVTAAGTPPISYQWQNATTGANISGATSSSYTIQQTTVADSGLSFQVVVTNPAGSITSIAATLTVNATQTAPSITTQPSNQTVTAGQTATFTVFATGSAPLSYQWQKNNANISGAPNSPSYTTPATTLGDSGSTFRVIVSNGVNPPATSNAATLTVNAAPVAPSITTQPANQTVTAGQTATFTVVATGTAPLSYQWQKNNANISGAPNAPSYTTPVTTTGDSGSTFRVIVSNGVNPPATSNSATLTVNAAAVAPSITTQPANQTVTAGQTATFTVVAAGTAPLSYQWQKNNANISGAPNSPSYTTPATTTGDSGSTFRVIVSNGVNPPATSNSATLTVNAAPVAPSITTQPSNQTVNAGQTATFTVVATGTAPLSYQWQKNNSNISGAPNSPSYTTPATALTDTGSTFRVIVSNGVNPPATSNSATLTVNGVAPSITTQPADQTVNAGQTATFTVVATGTAPLSYQWQKNNANISGAPNSPSYTTPATTIGDSGATFQVIVSNGVNPAATSNSATLTVNPAPPPPTISVLTYHNDNSRTGLNPNETILTTSNVNSTKFGKLGTLTVTGLVDAQPLYVPNLTINGATHNVVYVVTEHDMVYAFDADTPGAPLWQISVIPGTELPSDDRGCSQVTPEIGITSTPVIDLNAGPNGTIFVVSMSKAGSTYHQRLHAIDLVTHAELNGGPVDISGITVPGSGTGSSGGNQSFNPASYEERAALLLQNGVIYTTWSSHCDAPNYTGWVISFGESNLQRLSVLNLTANGTTQSGQEGAIWMSGDGPAADASNNVYFLVGNGTFDTTLNGSGFPNEADFGNSFMKLSTTGNTLAVADYFAMNNSHGTAEAESSSDTDLGSGGEMLLPDLKDGQGNIRHIAVGAGKDQNMYIVDRDNMGKFTTNDSGIYEELAGGLPGGVWSAPAYFNNTVYYGPRGNNLLAFSIANARIATSPSSSTTNSFGYPGTTPSVSANGTSNGIVWTLEAGSTGTLRAYDATNLATLLYTSNQAGSRDQFSSNSNDKFVTPMIANGKVYAGTPNAVVVFGLLP